MTKLLLTIFCIIFAVILVESAWLSPSMKSSHGKLKISIEYGTDDVTECNNECKGNCNETCGPDARCRYKCYVEECKCPKQAKKYRVLNENNDLVGCTTKCREYCNRTCGEDLQCREKCYVKTCQCPPPDMNEDFEENAVEDEENDEVYQIPRRSAPQKPQCCPVCMGKCMHRCDKEKSKC
uniref:Uncharacterized protein n=1 Tax=Panagrolaimus sp. ES5 TaxID=591445 RepID=A0AC34G9W4_9BILA